MAGAEHEREPESDAKPPDSAAAAAARTRRHLIEGAVVAGEIAATMIGQSKDLVAYSKRVIAGPHIVVTASSEALPSRPPLLCGRCTKVIDSPGIAIMRGRMATHVRCDWPEETPPRGSGRQVPTVQYDVSIIPSEGPA
jgi:hypothetical protein